jgi:chorismate mutase / prephenate dehydratase
MSIDSLRKNIDSVDKQILGFFNKRASLAKMIGAIKSSAGNDFYIPHREKKIVARLLKINKGPLSNASVESIFREIFNACRALESKLRVVYFGPEATFTHQAALKNFGSEAELVPVKSIGDVFTEVEKNRADYGVVPIENSTEGVVNYTLDNFIDSDLSICSEISMQIENYLLSTTTDMSRIRKVYSFYQPLAQCRNWLEENLPGIPVEETASTSDAAKRAAKEKFTAAVASKAAASLYGLEVVARGIEDSVENYTRFFVIGKGMAKRSGHDKTSIMFSIKDKVGALHDILFTFKQCAINLTKIESRPTKKKAWEYIFFADFLGHASEKKIKDALSRLGRNCVFVKILGSYPKAD